jgi:histidine phosphotransfer protein HptB
MSTDPVLDPATIESLRALSDDGEFLKEIAGIFIDDTPQRIAELDQCQVSGDTAKFTRAAHSIKGSAANIGATHLGAAAAQLETDSKTTPLPGLTTRIDAVKAEYARVEAELRKLTA